MASDGKVVSLNGQPIPPIGDPSPEVIAQLERLLEMARAGQIVGVAACLEHGDGATSGVVTGVVSRGLIGAVEMSKYDLIKALEE